MTAKQYSGLLLIEKQLNKTFLSETIRIRSVYSSYLLIHILTNEKKSLWILLPHCNSFQLPEHL